MLLRLIERSLLFEAFKKPLNQNLKPAEEVMLKGAKQAQSDQTDGVYHYNNHRLL